MSQIPQNQGMIKLSEVATDNSQILLDTQEREDSLTVIEQLRRITTDSLRRVGLLLVSQSVAVGPGSISWDGSNIGFISTNIVIKLLQNETGQVVDLVLNYGASNGDYTFLSVPVPDGQIFYIELNRNNIDVGPVSIANGASGGSTIQGKTAKVAATAPALTSPQSGNYQGTICIPLAVNLSGSMWWVPHGVYWPTNTTSPLGAVVTTTSNPLGSMSQYHKLGLSQLDPLGYESLRIVAPGYQLCNGSIIIDPNSPYRNPTRNNDGTPGPSFDSNQDVFTPNVNGPLFTWTNSRAYTVGDYVSHNGTNYVCILSIGSGGSTPDVDTTHWQPESVYNNLSLSNPYNKYRRTTQNDGQGNTYLRGSSQNWKADQAAGYNGNNTETLGEAHIPPHRHALQDTYYTDYEPDGKLHQHSWSTTSTGSHAHQIATETGGPSPNNFYYEVDSGTGWHWDTNYNQAGAHSHSGTTSTPLTKHYHALASFGGGMAHNNEPRYFNIINIIKIY